MKVYKTVFIVVPDDAKSKIKLAEFTFPLVGEIIVMGHSTFNFDVRKMLRSDLVVTVGEWHECAKCSKAIQVARIMDQTVIHETTFKSYVEQNYN